MINRKFFVFLVHFLYSILLLLSVCNATKFPTTRSPTTAPTKTCSNICPSNNFDGYCDDGGPGSTGVICFYGTDCADCGPREDMTRRPSTPYPTVETSGTTTPSLVVSSSTTTPSPVDGVSFSTSAPSSSSFDSMSSSLLLCFILSCVGVLWAM